MLLHMRPGEAGLEIPGSCTPLIVLAQAALSIASAAQTSALCSKALVMR